MPTTISLNKARTKLSAIGCETEKKSHKAFGALHAYANDELRAKEKGAWQRAVEEKYANPA